MDYIYPNIPPIMENGDRIFFTYTAGVQEIDITSIPSTRIKIECFGGQRLDSSGAGYAAGTLELSALPANVKKLYIVCGRGNRSQAYRGIYVPHAIDNADFTGQNVNFYNFGGGYADIPGSTDVRTVYDRNKTNPNTKWPNRPSDVDKGTMDQESLNSSFIIAAGNRTNQGHTETKIPGNIALSDTSIVSNRQGPSENGTVIFTILKQNLKLSPHNICMFKSGKTVKIPLYINESPGINKGMLHVMHNGENFVAPINKLIDELTLFKGHIKTPSGEVKHLTGIAADSDGSKLQTSIPAGSIDVYDRDLVVFPKGVDKVSITMFWQDGSIDKNVIFNVKPGTVYDFNEVTHYTRYYWDTASCLLVGGEGIGRRGRAVPGRGCNKFFKSAHITWGEDYSNPDKRTLKPWTLR